MECLNVRSYFLERIKKKKKNLTLMTFYFYAHTIRENDGKGI